MMKLMKRFVDWRTDPRGKVAELVPELSKFRTALCMSTDCPPLDSIVLFFNITSKWHDRSDEIGKLILSLQEVNRGQHTEMINKLTTLRTHFQNAGRDPYGWNRTEKGETVTAEKVFLGDIYGLFTNPVPFWRERRNAKKGGWGYSGMENFNPYDVVSKQAANFMRSHVGPICDIIEWLENNVPADAS